MLYLFLENLKSKQEKKNHLERQQVVPCARSLCRGLEFVSQQHVRQLTAMSNSSSRDLLLPSGLQRSLHAHVHVLTQIHT